MDVAYDKGDLVRIATEADGVFYGRFLNRRGNKTITLYDVRRRVQDKPVYEGEMTFGCVEIVCMQRVDDDPDEIAAKINRVELSNRDLDKYEAMTKRYLFINHVDDDEFKKALDDLGDNRYVAMGTDGADMGRKCKLSLLTLSTPEQIYIFDVQAMQQGAFDRGLRDVLERDDIKKIVHNARNISDCLYHRHEVKLRQAFDTQVADVLTRDAKRVELPETFRTLQECITAHLGLTDVVHEKVDIVEWSQRPVTVRLKETVSRNVVYLHRLAEVLYERMMQPFVRGTEHHVACLRTRNDLEAWRLSTRELQLTEEFRKAVGHGKAD